MTDKLDTPTPRTDAREALFGSRGYDAASLSAFSLARTLERDLAACRAALRELVECDDKLQQIITAGRANPHSTKNWPQIHGRNVAAWAAARKLIGDGND